MCAAVSTTRQMVPEGLCSGLIRLGWFGGQHGRAPCRGVDICSARLLSVNTPPFHNKRGEWLSTTAVQPVPCSSYVFPLRC